MSYELQKTFNKAYKDKLRADVESGQSLALYRADKFEVDPNGVRSIVNLWRPDGLAEKMVPQPDGDFQSAIALYEAYPGLSPLIASSEAFWAYLTHTELFAYVRNRYPKADTEKAGKEYILDHWFFGDKGVFRNALASLWWTIHLSVDNTRADRYELSKVFFRDYSTRSTFLAPTFFIRHREAMIGVLEFLLDKPEVLKTSPRLRFRFIAKYFNRMGAVKQITYLDRCYFRSECERIYPLLMQVNSEEDVSNGRLLYSRFSF